MSGDEDIIFVVQLEVNRCGLTYGQAPCTASGDPGFECYNTFSTCQDKPNYLPTLQKIFLENQNTRSRFRDDDSVVEGVPCITRWPRYTSTQVKRGDGVATRGGVQVECLDFAGPVHSKPDYLDPYYDTRQQPATGTFWGRFKALFPYISRSRMLCQSSREGTTDIYDQTYYLESIQGPDAGGKVVLKGRDILTDIDADHARTPIPDTAELDSSINPNATTITVAGYNPDAWIAPGVFLVEEELIFFPNFSAGTMTGVTRGYGGTNNVSHSAGEECQPARYWDGINICDVLYELLTVDAGIPASFIPYTQGVDPDAQWDRERAAQLEGYTITKAIPAPTGVNQLLDELCEQAYVNLFYIPELAQIWISATNTGIEGQNAIAITDTEHILAGSVKFVEREKRMISQAWAYYNPETVLAGSDPREYGDVDIQVNTELESPNAWGNKRVEVSYGSWLSGAGNIAITTNSRIITERQLPQYEITFQMDYNTVLYVGSFINLRTDLFQSPSGEPQEWTWQIVKARDVIPAARREYVAASVRPIVDIGELRFGNITDVFNESVEYGDATEPARAAWGWIAAVDGFSNGDTPYIMS